MIAPATVAVVGAGTMGTGIAQTFAQAGFDVFLHDSSAVALEKSQSALRSRLARLVDRDALDASQRDAALARITVSNSLDACGAADFVIEAIAEQPAAKRDVFSALDRVCRPEILFASNTSSVSITHLAAATSRPTQLFGMHFMNPAPVMPLVELIRGRDTSDDTMRRGREICGTLGKTAVESADTPGFIANRILMPMVNEAAYALQDGVASADAIDAVMTLGMKHPMGPLALADLIGLDVCLAILDVMHEGFNDPKYRACPLLRQLVEAGRLGRKSGSGFHDYDSPRQA